MNTESSLKEIFAKAKKMLEPSVISSYIPYTKKTGITFFLNQNKFCVKLKYSNNLIGNPINNVLHGGVIVALLQNTAQFYVVWEKNLDYVPSIIDISVNFLRKGRDVDTFAEAIIIKDGKRVVNVDAKAWHEDKLRPIASASMNFLCEINE
ncbi:MAG: hypothetical protein CFH01_01993 [Alphaproteobacteria bacterium MarineAlpha2_Bin1]|nr:MAG: hypothetical protein CFH01_01993 [Alphaproteobacteria bacterium MarineAlpha2_Bin1]